MRYFGIWVDELKKTLEEPDGTAGIGGKRYHALLWHLGGRTKEDP
jgi:hypothetical protein